MTQEETTRTPSPQRSPVVEISPAPHTVPEPITPDIQVSASSVTPPDIRDQRRNPGINHSHSDFPESWINNLPRRPESRTPFSPTHGSPGVPVQPRANKTPGDLSGPPLSAPVLANIPTLRPSARRDIEQIQRELQEAATNQQPRPDITPIRNNLLNFNAGPREGSWPQSPSKNPRGVRAATDRLILNMSPKGKASTKAHQARLQREKKKRQKAEEVREQVGATELMETVTQHEQTATDITTSESALADMSTSDATVESNQTALPATASEVAPTNEEDFWALGPSWVGIPLPGQQDPTKDYDTGSIHNERSSDEGELDQERLDESMDSDNCSSLLSGGQNEMEVDPGNDTVNDIDQGMTGSAVEPSSHAIGGGTVLAPEGNPLDGSDDSSDDSSDDDNGANAPHIPDERPEDRRPARPNEPPPGPTINDVLAAISGLAAVLNHLCETVTAVQQRQTEIWSALQRAEERAEARWHAVEANTSLHVVAVKATDEMETEAVAPVETGHNEAVDGLIIAPVPQMEPHQGEGEAAVNGDHEMQGNDNRKLVSKADRQQKRAKTRQVVAQRRKHRNVVANLNKIRGRTDLFSFITETLQLQYKETVRTLELTNATQNPAVNEWVEFNHAKLLQNPFPKLETARGEKAIDDYMVSFGCHARDQRGGPLRLRRKVQLHPAICKYGDIVKGLLTIAEEHETRIKARPRRRPRGQTI